MNAPEIPGEWRIVVWTRRILVTSIIAILFADIAGQPALRIAYEKQDAGDAPRIARYLSATGTFSTDAAQHSGECPRFMFVPLDPPLTARLHQAFIYLKTTLLP